jgi:dolichol-phosphate mannosyltransferase
MISIILPSHNEPNIKEMIKMCQAEFPLARIIVAEDKQGEGKGYATLKGIMYDQHFIPWLAEDIAVFIDADGDIHPRMIKRLLPFVDDFPIVVGSKAIGPLPFRRKIITILSRLYIKIMFGLDVDTQTGIKAFRTSAIPAWSDKGWLFDIELLVKAKRAGLRMIEIPVDAYIHKNKSMGVLWKAFKDSLKIWYRLSSR